jgi:hypothetical protein
MSSLSDELTADQTRLVNTVCAQFFQQGQWPIFQFVEAQLQQAGLDALTTLRSFPVVGAEGVGPNYSAVFYEKAGRVVPSPDSQVKLTLAGLRHIPNGNGLAADFLMLVGLLVAERVRARYSPVEVVKVNVTGKQVAALFPPHASERLAQLHALAQHEPPTRPDISMQPSDEYWWSDVGPSIRDYSDLAGLDDYLGRVSTQLEQPLLRARPEPPHPRALAGAIDYLDAVWQLRFKKKLVKLESLERAALLALPVHSADGFDTALSAFADIVGHLSVPDQPGASDQHPLTKLGAFLPPRLAGANVERIHGALTTLTLIKTVRHGMQHAKAAPEAAAALHVLGVGYPVRNWAWAWDTLRHAAINAFEALREEIQVTHRGA